MRSSATFTLGWRKIGALVALLAAILTAVNVNQYRISATVTTPEDAAASRAAPAFAHVLLINIDGFRQADLADPLLAPDMPNILALQASGVTYTNASTSIPSDSFPGLMNLITGASPRTTGIYYDVSYSRSLYPPLSQGTQLISSNGNVVVANGNGTPIPPGTAVFYDQSIDLNSDLGSGGGTPGFGTSSIDKTQLPLLFSNGQLVPVFPHSYLQVNTIFEVAHAAGMRTAYCDKHAGAYEIVNGPSGLGVDDYFSVESDAYQTATFTSNTSFIPVADKPKASGGLRPESNIYVSLGQDDLKFQAILNQIQGKDSRGNKAPVPALFGTEIVSLSSAEKVIKDSNGFAGGIDGTASSETVNVAMHTALSHIDIGIGKIVAALKAANLTSSTLIIISAKHGQTPRVGAPTYVDSSKSTVDPYVDSLVNAGIGVGNEDNDTLSQIWLTNQAQSGQALTILNGLKSNTALQINTIFSAGNFVAGFGDPTRDDRTPDFSIKLNPGVIIDSLPSAKRAEHGGYSSDETNVALIVSGGGPTSLKQNSVVTSAVNTRQVAVTALQALGLNPANLQGATAEGTTGLPGLAGVNTPPVIVTAASATPNPVSLGNSASFSVTAAGALPFTIAWNFGDSTTGTGSPVTHKYAAAGSFTAVATISDGVNAAVTSSVTVKVVAIVAGIAPDTDADGFSDAIEIAAGSNPLDPKSTPFGGAGPGTAVALIVNNVNVKLNFGKANSDIITMRGVLPIPRTGLAISGQQVVVDFSNVALAFTLKGLTSNGNTTGTNTFALAGLTSNGNSASSITVSRPVKRGASAFHIKLKGSFATILNSAGLVNATVRRIPVNVAVTLLFNKTTYTNKFALFYSAHQGGIGNATGAPNQPGKN